jgi:hypothetical protein
MAASFDHFRDAAKMLYFNIPWISNISRFMVLGLQVLVLTGISPHPLQVHCLIVSLPADLF